MGAGAGIPLGARVFDALTSDRPYREAMQFQGAKRGIETLSGTQFNPEVVAAFVSIPNEELERIAYQAAAMQRVGNIP
jgi:HD-GYP domain-containing protein (c-di-GMP phosphodiesterase class II)